MNLFKSLVTAAAVVFALPAFAQDITVADAYVRVSNPMAKSGGAFMVINNAGAADDRLVSASSDVAEMVQLHTNVQSADGVMQMVEVPEGFVIPAGGSHALARGGDHVMLMGLTRALADGDVVTMTLTFEKAGEITVEVPVDLKREDAMGGMQGNGHGHQHGMPSN